MEFVAVAPSNIDEIRWFSDNVIAENAT